MPRWHVLAGSGLLGLALTLPLTHVPTAAAPEAQAAPAAAADDPADYAIEVDPRSRGAEIADTMYGIFYEDINWAADGGLYAELVRNRSFEFSGEDAAGWNGLTGWDEVARGRGDGTVAVADDAQRLHERNRSYLRVDLDNRGAGSYGVRNSGFDGVALRKGASYDVSVWARTDDRQGTPLTFALQTGPGARLAKPVTVTARGDRWKKYTATLRATRTSDAGRLAVLAGGAGTLRLDQVSLFPEATYKNRPNGLRRDLAQKIAALDPGFLRFPGGCLVNTGSMAGYDADSGYERQRSYQWKDTVGPVEQRATNANFWGYNQTYGLGYFEYFQFAEDIGAMPLPVVPAMVTGCGQNRATDDPALLQRHIQDTLDLIEFANGPRTSEWGGLRARMGHPKPFGLTHVGVGNEENLPEEFFANFRDFRAAIEEAHPEITVVSNSGPDDEGPTFERLWELNREAGVEMVDEHYYNDPTWFLQNNDRYDSYDRNGPDVFLGEYASRDNKLRNAVAEAAFMTGLERNADIVKLASYAPLLAHVDHAQWKPDMIWFDNDQSWGSTSYEVQKLFMNNVGDRVVPSEATGDRAEPQPITGKVGLSTWATQAAYDDVRVTRPDGTVLWSDDFADGQADGWSPLAGRGSWSVQDGRYVQSDARAENTLVAGADVDATDYDISLKATKLSGNEGFLVGFGVQDSDDLYWWNLGGFNNTRSLVEKSVGGAKQALATKEGHRIETGRTYDVRIEVRGTAVKLYLDGELLSQFDDDAVAEPFAQVVTRDEETGELIVKVVNAQDRPARTRVDLGVRTRGTAETTVITGDPEEVNTRTAQPVRAETTTERGIGREFTRSFAPWSVTFMRVATR